MRFLFPHFQRYFWRNFGSSDLEAFPPRFLWGDDTWVPCDSFLGDLAPSNPGNRFGFDDFRMNLCSWCSCLRFAIPHDWKRLGTWSFRHRLSMRQSYFPQSFASIRWVNREIDWLEVWVWPAGSVLFVPSLDRSDQSGTPVWPVLVDSEFLRRSFGSKLVMTREILGSSFIRFWFRLL